MRRILLFSFASLFVFVTHAQTILVSFDFNGIRGDEPTITSTPNITGVLPSLIFRGTGLAAANNADRFNANSFTEGATLDTADYFQFSVAPAPGYSIRIASVYFQGQRSATGPRSFLLRSSVDNYQSNLGTQFNVPDVNTTFNNTFSFSIIETTTPVIFRLYGFAAEGSSGSFGPGDGSGIDLAVEGPAATVLPVKFANLRAAKKGTAVSVQFSNLTEEDIAAYSIERAAPGRGFVEIGRLAPQKNNNTEASYNWEDKAPQAGVNLYRIKAVETTGKQVLSGVLKIDLSANGTALQIVPNPVRGQTLGLQVTNLPAGVYQVRIFGANAQALSNYTLQHSGGSLTQQLPLRGLQPGQYLLQLEGVVRLQQSFLVQQ